MEVSLPAYLTLSEVAELYRCSKRTLYRRIASGELPAEKRGARGQILVSEADAKALLSPVKVAR